MKTMTRLLSILCAALLTLPVLAGNYVGDYAPGDTVDCKFTTYRPSTGATFTLGGSPVVSAYKDNSTTQTTTGVTLTADFDSITGLNHVRVTTGSDGTFFSAGSNIDLIVTTGTVDSVSVTGSAVCSFSLNKVSALRPTTAARTLDVSSGGEAGIDWANVGSPTTTLNLSGTSISTSQAVASVASVGTAAISEASFATTAGSFAPLGLTRQGTAQAATGTTSITLDASAPFANNTIIGGTLWVYGSTAASYWQPCLVDAYVASTQVATVTCASGYVTPTGTISYKLFGTASASGGGATAAEVWAYGTRTLTALDEDSTTIDLNGSAVGSVVGAVGSVTGAVGSVTGNVGGNVTGSVGSVVGAVGSVTGNVGGNVVGSVGSVATNGISAASVATDAVTEIQNGLATAAALATVDTVVDAVQAKTDQLNFTSGNVQADAQMMNAATILGNGTTGNEWRGQ